MANGVNYALAIADKIAIDQGKIDTDIKVWSDTYECAATAADTVINLARLEDGKVIHGMILAFDDLGTGVTVDIGDTDDIDRYKDGVDVSTAAGSDSTVLVDGLGYVIGTNDGDNVITAKILGAAATGTLKLTVFYA